MHANPTPDPALEQNRLQRTLLELLLTEDTPGLWSTTEIATAMGDELLAADAIVALEAAGLVHVHDQFVFPTRAAGRYWRLEEAG